VKAAAVWAIVLLAVSAAIPLSAQAATPEDERVRQANELKKHGDPRAAIAILEPIANAAKRNVPSETEGLVWNLLGSSYQELEMLDKARFCYERSIDTLRSISSAQSSLALALNNLGSVELELGRFDDSKRLSKRARDLYVQIGDHAGIAGASTNLAVLEFQRGRLGPARKFLLTAVRESKQTTALDDDDVAAILSVQGRFALIDHQPALASSFFSQAIDHWIRVHGSTGYLVGIGLLLRAQAYSSDGDFTHASSDLQQAMIVFAVTPGRTSALYWRATLEEAQLMRQLGHRSESESLEQQATNALKEIQNRQCGNCTVSVEALR
jgi:tetratricopeptide (TPR) repeat protein